MRVVTTFLPRSPDACWRVMVDPARLADWVPGLRRAVVIASGPFGLPAEVHFEFSTSLTYTLVYSYDLERREMRFEPRLGKRDGVRGYVRIEPADDGARIEYGLEEGEARSPAERELGGADAIVAAFTKWMLSDADR